MPNEKEDTKQSVDGKKPFKSKFKKKNFEKKPGPAAVDSKKYNDPSYYGMASLLGKQAANISTAFVYGREPDVLYAKIVNSSGETDVAFTPANTGSMMLLRLSMTIPNVKTTEYETPSATYPTINAFDRCMVKFFVKLRGSKTSTVPWEAPDLGIYCLSMGSVLALQGFIERVFADVNRVIPNNLLTPKALIEHELGLGAYDDIVANLGNYTTRYLKISELLASLPMPGDMPFFKRCRSIFSRWYTDDVNFYGSNQYAFVPGYLYKFNALKTDTGGGCDVVGPIAKDNTENYTMGQLLDVYEGLLDALYFDEDIRNIGAWMQANWEESFYVSPTFNPQEEAQDAPNSDEILSMIMNASITPAKYRDGVKQDAAGRLLCHDYSFKYDQVPQSYANVSVLRDSLDHIMNAYHDLTPEDVMVFSRLSSVFVNDTRFSSKDYVYKGDFFVCERVDVVLLNGTAYTARIKFDSAIYVPATDWRVAFDHAKVLSYFDYAPTIYFTDSSDMSTGFDVASQRQSHLVNVPVTTLVTMNEVSVQAQFGLLAK